MPASCLYWNVIGHRTGSAVFLSTPMSLSRDGVAVRLAECPPLQPSKQPSALP
jgi:hypothetical protein